MVEPVSQFKSKSGLKRIIGAFGYSMDGFRSAWRHEAAFRQEMLLMVVGTISALSMAISAFEKFMLIGVLVLMLIVELMNSAIEARGRPHFSRPSPAVEKCQGFRQCRRVPVGRPGRHRLGRGAVQPLLLSPPYSPQA